MWTQDSWLWCPVTKATLSNAVLLLVVGVGDKRILGNAAPYEFPG